MDRYSQSGGSEDQISDRSTCQGDKMDGRAAPEVKQLDSNSGSCRNFICEFLNKKSIRNYDKLNNLIKNRIKKSTIYD